MSLQSLTNVVIVQKLADFPAPVTGVIKLEDNLTYFINGSVNIGTNQIERGVSNLILGEDKSNDKLIYTGTSAMFIDGTSGVNQDVSFALCTFAAITSGGSVFNISGTTYNCEIRDCIFGSCTSIGTIAVGNIHNFRNNLITGCANGVSFSSGSAASHLTVIDNISVSNTGTCTSFNINAGTYDSIIIGRLYINAIATQTCFNINASAVVTNGIISATVFEGAGSKLTGITNIQTNWLFSGNQGISNGVTQLWIDPYSISPVAVTVPTVAACTTAALSSVTGEIALVYSGTADQNACVSFRVPKDYFSGGKFKIAFAASTTVASVNIVFNPIFTIKKVGDTINTITETPTKITIASGTAFVSQETGYFTVATSLAVDNVIVVRLTRPSSSDASDTYTGSTYVLGLVFEYNKK
jgi:hypothetical protein